MVDNILITGVKNHARHESCPNLTGKALTVSLVSSAALQMARGVPVRTQSVTSRSFRFSKLARMSDIGKPSTQGTDKEVS